MTYRELKKQLELVSDARLDTEIIIYNVSDNVELYTVQCLDLDDLGLGIDLEG